MEIFFFVCLAKQFIVFRSNQMFFFLVNRICPIHWLFHIYVSDGESKKSLLLQLFFFLRSHRNSNKIHNRVNKTVKTIANRIVFSTNECGLFFFSRWDGYTVHEFRIVRIYNWHGQRPQNFRAADNLMGVTIKAKNAKNRNID